MVLDTGVLHHFCYAMLLVKNEVLPRNGIAFGYHLTVGGIYPLFTPFSNCMALGCASSRLSNHHRHSEMRLTNHHLTGAGVYPLRLLCTGWHSSYSICIASGTSVSESSLRGFYPILTCI